MGTATLLGVLITVLLSTPVFCDFPKGCKFSDSARSIICKRPFSEINSENVFKDVELVYLEKVTAMKMTSDNFPSLKSLIIVQSKITCENVNARFPRVTISRNRLACSDQVPTNPPTVAMSPLNVATATIITITTFMIAEKRKPGGAVYTRWGRNGCPKEAELVYKGFAGGSRHSHPGGSVNYICLPYDPTWGKYNDIQKNDNQNLHGVEYAGNSIDISGTPFDSRIRGHVVPCAVCRSTKRITVLRIPGRNKCYKGWHLEYAGYLMADKYTHKSGTEYACVDERPEITKSGPVSKGGKYFYPVEGYCGRSLLCPPYVHGREITCCVCTK